VVDTNCDPDLVQYVIPGNDDAIRSGTLMCRIIADAVEEGRFIASKRNPGQPGPQRTPEQEAAIAAAQADARRQAARAQAERDARLAGGAPAPDDAIDTGSDTATDTGSDTATDTGADTGGEPATDTDAGIDIPTVPERPPLVEQPGHGADPVALAGDKGGAAALDVAAQVASETASAAAEQSTAAPSTADEPADVPPAETLQEL